MKGKTRKIPLWSHEVDGDFQPYLEMFPLDSRPTTTSGLILVCPGGGYSGRSPRESAIIAERFNRLDWHAAVLQYRVAPNVFPAPQKDALRALKLIRSHAAEWGVDKHQIAILGFSAGGHLAACAGTMWDRIDADAGDDADREDARPDALILCYPVIDLSIGHMGSARNLLGKTDPPADELKKLSLENCVTKETPPAFLWHTAADEAIPYENSILFAEAMWKLDNIAELHIFPRGPHGLAVGQDNGRITEIRIWPELASNFLKTVGFSPCR